ncbi:MAG: DnaJ C-terminal domain-containing protein, partial [Halobacteriales archaeon]
DALGVSRDASQDEIKSAYREKAREYHPDASDHENAQERFKEIQEAYEVLTDEEKRQAYDRMGHDRYVQAQKQGFDPSDAGAAGAGQRRARGGMGGAGGFEGGLGDIFDNIFGGGFGGGGGPDATTSVTVTLEEVYEGTEKTVSYTTTVDCDACDGTGAADPSNARRCSTCGGSGRVEQRQRTPFGQATTVTDCPDCGGSGTEYDEPCDECKGDGEVHDRVTRTVEIPAGVEDGTTLRLRDGGNEVHIEVRVEEHDIFEREGADVYYAHPVSFPQAVFGDTVTVPTLGGDVEMDVPEGARSGETFRLSDRGLPRMQRRGRGDQYVRVEVVVPDPSDLTDEQREALAEFASAGGDEIEYDEGFLEKLRRGVFG